MSWFSSPPPPPSPAKLRPLKLESRFTDIGPLGSQVEPRGSGFPCQQRSQSGMATVYFSKAGHGTAHDTLGIKAYVTCDAGLSLPQAVSSDNPLILTREPNTVFVWSLQAKGFDCQYGFSGKVTLPSTVIKGLDSGSVISATRRGRTSLMFTTGSNCPCCDKADGCADSRILYDGIIDAQTVLKSHPGMAGYYNLSMQSTNQSEVPSVLNWSIKHSCTIWTDENEIPVVINLDPDKWESVLKSSEDHPYKGPIEVVTYRRCTHRVK